MDLQIYGFGAAALIVVIVEVLKRSAIALPSRWAGIVAVLLGLLLATLFKLDSPNAGTWLQLELAGLAAGLTAAGGYSATRAATER